MPSISLPPSRPARAGRALSAPGLAALLGLAALSLPAPATAAMVSGIGSRDCQAFMRSVEINSRAAIDAYIAWSQGYLSGYDRARPGTLGAAVDGESLSYWLIDACQGAPERSIVEVLDGFLARQRR